MEQIFDAQTITFITKLSLAMLFGMVIGTERLLAHKTAGMRTYALISMGSALFIIISILVSAQYVGIVNFDPLRLAAQVVAATGFLGAGLIFVKNGSVTGFTTSTGLWVSAAIGVATGFGLYKLAFVATMLVLFIFIALWFIEQRLKKTAFFENNLPTE